MILDYIKIALASLGLILATSSFISGLQLVRGTSSGIEGKIHRFNGYVSLSIYIVLTLLSFARSGFNPLTLLAWLSGLGLILLKIRTVRKKGRFVKYASWIGVSLVIMWLYVVYIHIPV